MDTPKSAAGLRPNKLFILVFAILFALLVASYYFFLRTEYIVLYEGIKPADASVIVAELDAKTTPYRLRDNGTTILVPSDQADSVRLGLVGSEASSRGLIGFELFNKSDMGLTDFAQKINYQRALQGELARTIMTMDGIDGARVHLAIPDRSLFRGVRSEPKAAVTLIVQPGKAVDDRRVEGIQRLVAAAVAELPLANVVVLDDIGRVISASSAMEPLVAPQVEERTAVRQYYRARVRSAVESIMPGLKFEVRVLLLASESEPGLSGWDAQPRSDDGMNVDGASVEDENDADRAGGGAASLTPGDRDFGMRVLLITPSILNAEQQQIIENAAIEAVGLNRAVGDTFAFRVGQLAAPAIPSTIAPETYAAPASDPAAAAKKLAQSNSWLLPIAALVALGGIMFVLRRRASGLSAEERDSYVQRIRRQLNATEEAENARA